MRAHGRTALLALVLTATGCYHATINTGRQPNGQTINQPWAHSFVGGLVPPAVVETASQCPNGVARVETQHSFLNMLAAFVTFSIYTPMTITVQCAGGDDDAASAVSAEGRDGAAAILEAANRAASTGHAQFIDLR
jgi:hypothetical protein